ncbi:Putative phosphopantetheine binding ACP domain, methyltransferase type 12, ACP-like superfamily [Colletotrichum destructivum]|uniref:Phosphopantetheine binding ACP domain, methyltransferase type 12, ACP-like superfamily n=1 Tax=Colletotrichum destructivum TaxID=34406 RepID=A0AAX4J1I6_9PEZI|nr:Putative phosphopantetheine binding ACP domain, methyltransferase type 12, ACP-like superfamily [Colletotrichum destructivum]
MEKYHTVTEPDVMSPNFEFSPAQDDSALYYANIETLERLTMCYIRRFVEGVSVSQQASFPKWHHRHMTSVFRRRLLVHDEKHQQQQQHQYCQDKNHDDNVGAMLAQLEVQDVVNARLVRAVGENLRAVCEGRRDMLEVLLEQDGELSRLYDRGIAMADANRAVAQLIGLVAHRYPRMKFLEVGGGTGSTTKYVLEALAGRFRTYTFTDISAGFFARSEEKLSKYDDDGGHGGKIEYRVLDIERDPTSQGFTNGAYDLIIAANCVHATKSLGTTLAHLRDLLRPGGFLVLFDITGDPIWLSYSFVFGGLDQWWAGAADDGRVDGPGVSRARWDSELRKSGFSGLDQAVPFPRRREMFSVMLSQAVHDEAGTVLALRQPTLALNQDSSSSRSRRRFNRQAFAVVGASSLSERVVNQFGRHVLNVTHVPSLDHVGAAKDPASSSSSSSLFAPGKNLAVMLMTELDMPLFAHLSGDTLASFKLLLRSSRYFMVVTRRCRDENPDSNMLVGVLRALFAEMPHFRFQCIDIDDLDVRADNFDRTSDILSASLLRMVLVPLLEDEPSRNDDDNNNDKNRIMWSMEPELLVRDGCVQIPRVVKDTAKNDRLNSSTRLIEQKTCRSQHLVELDTAQIEPWKPYHYMDTGDGGRPSLPPHLPRVPLIRRPLPDGLPADYRASMCPIETTVSTVRCLPYTPGQQRFHLIVGAIDRQRCPFSTSSLVTGTRVAALCPVNPATTVYVPLDNVYKMEHEKVPSLSLFSDEVILLATLSSMMLRRTALLVTDDSKVLLLNPGRDLSNMMSKLSLPREITDRLLLAGVGASPPTAEIRWGSIGAVVDMGGGLNDHATDSQSRENSCSGEWMQEIDDLGPWVLRYRYPIIPPVSESQSRSIFFCACADLANLDHSASTAYQDGTAPTSLFDWRSSIFTTQVQPLDFKALFRADRTYLLVGLSSDLGLSLCRWMVANGARHVAIASRHAPNQVRSSLYLTFAEDMRRAGAYFAAVQCDVTRRASLEAAVWELAGHLHMPPVAGIAHGAMVLQDKLFADMTVLDLEEVIAPKALGAANLDALFGGGGGDGDDREPPTLDFFVMMSSTACIIGNISQSNYHAGNMFMAALVERRRARGLPASVLHLSAVAGVGYVHRLPERARDFTNTFALLHEEDLHLAFGEAIAAGRPGSGANGEVICTIKTKRKKEKTTGSVVGDPTITSWLDNPRFSTLVEDDGSQSDATVDGNGSAAGAAVRVTDLGAALRAVPASDRAQAAQLIQASFVRKLETALRKSPGTIDAQLSLSAVGLDSVLAVEMRFWFLKTIMVEIPVLKFMHQSVAQISEWAAGESVT